MHIGTSLVAKYIFTVPKTGNKLDVYHSKWINDDVLMRWIVI